MDDVISRQAAIDAAIEAVDEWDGGYNLTRADMIEDAINNAVPSVEYEQLPSAQPDHIAEVSKKVDADLISRQDAIDALDCINGVEEVLRSLPSAQSEEHTQERTETHACDLISRQAAIDGGSGT